MFPGRMGGRKFKLGRSHKNYERKRLRTKKNKPGRPRKVKTSACAPPKPTAPPKTRPNEPCSTQEV